MASQQLVSHSDEVSQPLQLPRYRNPEKRDAIDAYQAKIESLQEVVGSLFRV